MAGWRSDAVVTPPLHVTKDGIAHLAGVRLTTVVGWMLRCPDFPGPRKGLPDEPMWLRAEVEAWLRASGREKLLRRARR